MIYDCKANDSCLSKGFHSLSSVSAHKVSSIIFGINAYNDIQKKTRGRLQEKTHVLETWREDFCWLLWASIASQSLSHYKLFILGQYSIIMNPKYLPIAAALQSIVQMVIVFAQPVWREIVFSYSVWCQLCTVIVFHRFTPTSGNAYYYD